MGDKNKNDELIDSGDEALLEMLGLTNSSSLLVDGIFGEDDGARDSSETTMRK